MKHESAESALKPSYSEKFCGPIEFSVLALGATIDATQRAIVNTSIASMNKIFICQ